MNDLCYCIPSPGTENRLGHVHAAKITPEEWAKGIMAIAALSNGSRMNHLAGLPKAIKQAQKILTSKTKPKRGRLCAPCADKQEESRSMEC